MKKNTIVLMAVPMLIGSMMLSDANAGNGRISIGAELGSPTGGYGDVTSMGYGGTLRYELPVGYSIGVTATAGYLLFTGKDSYDGTTFSQIPIQLGAKAYFKEDQAGFYGQLMMGMHISSSDAVGAESRSNFSWAPEIGYQLANVDFGLRWQYITTSGIYNAKWVGLRVAYIFGSYAKPDAKK